MKGDKDFELEEWITRNFCTESFLPASFFQSRVSIVLRGLPKETLGEERYENSETRKNQRSFVVFGL